MCHLLMAMPFLGLLLFTILPLRSALSLYFVVLFFSAAFYFLMFRAMSAKVVSGKEGMVGKTCRALAPFDKNGKVAYGSEIWSAHSDVPIQAGQTVRIIGLRDLVVLVEPQTPSIDTKDEKVV